MSRRPSAAARCVVRTAARMALKVKVASAASAAAAVVSDLGGKGNHGDKERQ